MVAVGRWFASRVAPLPPDKKVVVSNHPAGSCVVLAAFFIDRQEDFRDWPANISTGCGDMGRLGTVFVGRVKVSPYSGPVCQKQEIRRIRTNRAIRRRNG